MSKTLLFIGPNAGDKDKLIARVIAVHYCSANMRVMHGSTPCLRFMSLASINGTVVIAVNKKTGYKRVKAMKHIMLTVDLNQPENRQAALNSVLVETYLEKS
jgi:putative Ca2+/H+ antiporter (TMEM165/GDT1 family)